MSNSRLVYSTETGPIKQPNDKKGKKKQNKAKTQRPPDDGIVRIHRETKGRKGKGVTTVTGLPLDDAALKALAKKLKQLCGSGGSVKDGIIEIQGDHRDTLKSRLEALGYRVKLAGG